MGHRFDPSLIAKLDNPERRKFLPPDEILSLLEIKKQDDLADIGCGPGYFTIPAAYLTSGAVYGVDVEPKMLETLKEKAAAAGVKNITPIQSDAENIRLPDGSVDKAICSQVLHEVDDLDKSIHEMKRILRPNGKLLIIEWEKKETESGPPLAERLGTSFLQKKFEQAGFQTQITKPNPNHYIIIAY
ncbi:class I SAM-dependent methyltransferase [Aneurinibacillus terranovensis]|uniref:class I SAM-dependent methyltransferase n=1 Tax=Aneurinibacillus terranovensis TaxID=278991 RepID=UPI00040DB60B|nr:class I SAM-dependent methyltransferase [Aneurinibacillus terranovensis]